ncbi:hypothetical protein CLV58_113141 [Spirosoma oryzae]|uniref:Uncharacterized protein n=1 Tax=Spirosoma oryzae TaxID=1469603 RepID=A0A2T0SRH9_9BACT|nr:hypothetical protein [Spirosoma oryzae]PRY36010.1 hypothetical protein CLV58_113141 [Spirosoma oryzae]
MELDSKQLFVKAEFLSYQVEWANDWQYIGLETGFEERFARILGTIFGSENVILIRGRHDSAVFSQRDIRNLLFQGLGDSDFKIWSLDFALVLAFSRIGVYRRGLAGQGSGDRNIVP